MRKRKYTDPLEAAVAELKERNKIQNRFLSQTKQSNKIETAASEEMEAPKNSRGAANTDNHRRLN